MVLLVLCPNSTNSTNNLLDFKLSSFSECYIPFVWGFLGFRILYADISTQKLYSFFCGDSLASEILYADISAQNFQTSGNPTKERMQ